MKRIEDFFEYMLTGIGIGSIVSVVSIAAMKGMDDTILQVLVWLAASALFTAISKILCVDFGSLLARTVIHFVLCFLVAVTVGSFLHYSDGWIASAKEMFPAFLLIYVIIYVIMFWVRLMAARELNKKLSE